VPVPEFIRDLRVLVGTGDLARYLSLTFRCRWVSG
jgi:hypothetical protein